MILSIFGLWVVSGQLPVVFKCNYYTQGFLGSKADCRLLAYSLTLCDDGPPLGTLSEHVVLINCNHVVFL